MKTFLALNRAEGVNAAAINSCASARFMSVGPYYKNTHVRCVRGFASGGGGAVGPVIH